MSSSRRVGSRRSSFAGNHVFWSGPRSTKHPRWTPFPPPPPPCPSLDPDYPHPPTLDRSLFGSGLSDGLFPPFSDPAEYGLVSFSYLAPLSPTAHFSLPPLPPPPPAPPPPTPPRPPPPRPRFSRSRPPFLAPSHRFPAWSFLYMSFQRTALGFPHPF